jgi:DNA-binding MarR family transcriptional regulator
VSAGPASMMVRMDPATADAAEALRVAVGEFVRAARSHEELSGSQLAALGLLDRDGPATIAAVAATTRIRHQSATKLIAQLESAGAVEVGPHPADRRAVEVRITERGRAVVAAERRRRSAWIAAAMEARLTPEERRHLERSAELLERLAAEPPVLPD